MALIASPADFKHESLHLRIIIVTCEDAEDGTGDLIIPLPDDLLAAIGLTSGDKLNMEKQPDGTITLTVRHQHDAETLLGVLADLYHVCHTSLLAHT